ncbi:hypothetical protein TRFO_16285 [Tritrichomonas foetus]|uniref:Uncharacterized protein n=1 Tax=Tritrichomonas foetus TaxID=1144522 RepID=A0A1J4KQK5_9EUKA|nr:hypothetical protein TRFO_16285 [Tritrichomonas foetus]|eukprot:OHT13523.1 hypothetical protein TRFO_16285 [Tritrichomonas foetus]
MLLKGKSVKTRISWRNDEKNMMRTIIFHSNLWSSPLNHNIDDLKIIDDFIYIIDHIEASTILLDNLSKVRDDVALYILDIIGYSSNILQNEKVKLLYLKNDIKKYAHGCEGDYSIVNRLITTEHCELASNYIEQFVQCKNDIILKNVEFFLFHDKVKLSIFLRHISDYFELIASEIYETIPILANLCPDSIKPYFYAYASLPKPIQKISSLLNKSSVTKAICTSNLDLIINLEKKHLILFSENNLVEILEESAKYKTFNNFIKDSIHLSTLVHDNDIFKQINSKIVNEEIFKIKVDSIESEFNALLHIEKIQRFESVCPLFYDTSQILESYHGLLYRTPFFSTGIPYSLSENLDVICLKLDLDDIAYTFPSVNQIKYTEQRCKILISLGRFEESINFLSCHNFTIEMDETFLIPLIYKEVFNFEALSMMYQNGIEGFNNNNVCEPAQMPFYKTIISNCRSKKKKLNLLPFCLDFCEKFATKETFFGISIRYGNLNDTIDRLLSIQNISEQIDLFIYRIVSNAIAYNKLQYLQNELSEKTFWASLLNFCTDKKMSILALDLRLLLNQKEELALAYIDIFGETKNTSKQLVYIGSAMNILVELIKEREKALLNHEKVLSTTNIEKITDLFILSTLQYDICTFFYEERINFSQNMNLFHDKKSSFEIGNALIQNNQMWLLKRVSEVMQIPEKDIVKYSFQKITDRDAKIVCDLVESTQSEKRFWTSYSHMFLNILSLSKNYELIPLIISSIIPVKDLPYILYEFDFLSQALSTINSQKTSFDLLPAIAARASILGDVELIYICNDQVSNLLEK